MKIPQCTELSSVKINKITVRRADSNIPEVMKEAAGGTLKENIIVALKEFTKDVYETGAKKEVNMAFQIPQKKVSYKQYPTPVNRGVITHSDSILRPKEFSSVKLTFLNEHGDAYQPSFNLLSTKKDIVSTLINGKNKIVDNIINGIQEVKEQMADIFNS